MSAAPLLDLYRTMVRIQANDERFRSLVSSGQFKMMYFSPRGQEAIAAGMMAALEPGDYLATIYRGLHDQIAKGASARRLWAEYLGRADGPCGGKGGPMHMADIEAGIMLTTGVVGSGLPIANGFALTSVLRNDGRVTVATFGDGASNIGAFHEALNMAAVWKLPVVFCCQNNGYGEHTRRTDAQLIQRISDRAAGYGMPGETVDGTDPVAVYEVARRAVDRARAGEGPTLVEAVAYRFFGHYFGANTKYVPADEVAAREASEPISRFRSRLLDEGVAEAEELDRIVADAAAEADDARDYALALPEPSATELLTGVYAGGGVR